MKRRRMADGRRGTARVELWDIFVRPTVPRSVNPPQYTIVPRQAMSIDDKRPVAMATESRPPQTAREKLRSGEDLGRLKSDERKGVSQGGKESVRQGGK